jgi:hypothetical protein
MDVIFPIVGTLMATRGYLLYKFLKRFEIRLEDSPIITTDYLASQLIPHSKNTNPKEIYICERFIDINLKTTVYKLTSSKPIKIGHMLNDFGLQIHDINADNIVKEGKSWYATGYYRSINNIAVNPKFLLRHDRKASIIYGLFGLIICFMSGFSIYEKRHTTIEKNIERIDSDL